MFPFPWCVDSSFSVDNMLAFNWIVSPPVALAIGNQVASATTAGLRKTTWFPIAKATGGETIQLNASTLSTENELSAHQGKGNMIKIDCNI